eukprot:1178346-Prorocentrum_minimum.AAC.2
MSVRRASGNARVPAAHHHQVGQDAHNAPQRVVEREHPPLAAIGELPQLAHVNQSHQQPAHHEEGVHALHGAAVITYIHAPGTLLEGIVVVLDRLVEMGEATCCQTIGQHVSCKTSIHDTQ